MLAHRQVLNAFAYGLHHTRVLGAGYKGQGRLDLVLVLHNQQVGKVQGGCLDFNQHFAGFGHGCGQLLPDKGIYAGGVVAKPGMHGGFFLEEGCDGRLSWFDPSS